MPSWAKNHSQNDYAKVIADFEMLKLCDVTIGPVSSNYAKTAAVESMLTRGYLTQHGMCTNARGGSSHVASLEDFERKRGVRGMFSECKALPGTPE